MKTHETRTHLASSLTGCHALPAIALNENPRAGRERESARRLAVSRVELRQVRELFVKVDLFENPKAE